MANQQNQGDLLTSAQSVYAWVYMHPHSLQHVINVETATDGWKGALRQAWPSLLPSERRAVADRLLGAAADWAETGMWPFSRIDFETVETSVCNMMRWHDATAINERWDALQMAVDAVQLAYRSTFPGSHTSRTAKSPEQIWAAWYRGHQNRQRGVSRAKFERLGPVAAQLVVTAIRAVEPEVNAAKEPAAAQALLPDPFLVLEQAQVLAESAEQRLLEYAGLVSTAATLYARDQRPSRNDPGKTRSRIMNEAYMWFLGPVCLARFKEYSPLEQRRLVDKARERVYLAAQSVLVQQLWEDADQLAEELCASFKDAPAQQPSSAQLPGSSQNHPYQVDSLAHSSSAPRMSPYYARKYYSSSSLARQARLI